MDVNSKIKVLFVCTGNICRSPLAQGLFVDYLSQLGLNSLFEVDSAGTSDYHVGQNPDERAIKVANEEYGVGLSHIARQLSIEDFNRFDYILVMDHLNYDAVLDKDLNHDFHDKVMLFRSFDPLAEGFYDVPDPYYGGAADFYEIGEIVIRCSIGFIEFLRQQGNLLNK